MNVVLPNDRFKKFNRIKEIYKPNLKLENYLDPHFHVGLLVPLIFEMQIRLNFHNPFLWV